MLLALHREFERIGASERRSEPLGVFSVPSDSAFAEDLGLGAILTYDLPIETASYDEVIAFTPGRNPIPHDSYGDLPTRGRQKEKAWD